MKNYNQDIFQFFEATENPIQLRETFPEIREPLKKKEQEKIIYDFSCNFPQIAANFPYEVEITLPSSVFLAFDVPKNWTSKEGSEILKVLEALLDPKKKLRNNMLHIPITKKYPYEGEYVPNKIHKLPLAVFSGIGISPLNIEKRNRVWDKMLGDLHPVPFSLTELKIFFRFGSKKNAEDYIKQLKKSKGFKVFKGSTKLYYFNPKSLKQSNKTLYSSDMFWWRRALMFAPPSHYEEGLPFPPRSQISGRYLNLPDMFTPLIETNNRINWFIINKNFGKKKKSLSYLEKGKKLPAKKSKTTTYKKISASQIKTEAKKYSKRRSAKRWQNLMKKFGMTQARKIVKASKKLAPKKRSQTIR